MNPTIVNMMFLLIGLSAGLSVALAVLIWHRLMMDRLVERVGEIVAPASRFKVLTEQEYKDEQHALELAELEEEIPPERLGMFE